MSLDDVLRIRCEPSLKAKLEAIAGTQRRTMSNLALSVLESYCQEEEASIMARLGKEEWERRLKAASKPEKRPAKPVDLQAVPPPENAKEKLDAIRAEVRRRGRQQPPAQRSKQ